MSYTIVNVLWPIMLAYLTVHGIFFFFQKSLLFFPDQTSLKKCSIVNLKNFEYFEQDDVRYIKSTKENAKANLVLFHGNAGSACNRSVYVEGLNSLPINIILAEYPGYAGDTFGEMSEESFLLNAQKIISKIKRDKLPIFLYGESLGSAVATYLASKNEIRGLLLNNAYTSITDIAKIHYPFLLVEYLNTNSFNAKSWAKAVNVAPIVFEGVQDQIIPIENVEQQVKNFKKTPFFHRIQNVGHNDLLNSPIVFEEAKNYILDRL